MIPLHTYVVEVRTYFHIEAQGPAEAIDKALEKFIEEAQAGTLRPSSAEIVEASEGGFD
jgi:hypothetical protein